jgi:peptide/nickel transport system ATP-binding protein
VSVEQQPALRVDGLTIALSNGEPIVQDINLTVASGRVLGLVGESGSGKSTTALGLLGYTSPGVAITEGTVTLGGQSVLGLPERRIRRIRGRTISYVPQDPGSGLNPSRRIGDAITAMLKEHGRDVNGNAASVLERVRLPATDEFARRFPHQLSGGQQQRVAIAIAIVCEPPVVVLDEPTTGLDVVTQAHIIQEIDRLRKEQGLSLVYVSHDLGVIAQVADDIAVMYAGRIVEQGPAAPVLRDPKHPYTRGLISAVPDSRVKRRLRGIPGIAVGIGERPPGCAFAPRCALRTDECEVAVPSLDRCGPGRAVRCIHWTETIASDAPETDAQSDLAAATTLLSVVDLRAEHRTRHATVRAADAVSFEIARGECLALVGESGSGKTTIARCVAGLHSPSAGQIVFDGDVLASTARLRTRDHRRRIQLIFQNPNDSLNPHHSVGDEITRPARVLLGLSSADAAKAVDELLAQVRLPRRLAERFPGELSGGERQRVAIARALAARPDLIICDEITSALDVSVQAAVLELLEELRTDLGLAMLFITHDLGVVSSIADRVIVLHGGAMCELGPVRQVLDHPTHAYTQTLLAAAMSLHEWSAARGDTRDH